MKIFIGAAALAAGIIISSGAFADAAQGLNPDQAGQLFKACQTAAKATKSDKAFRGVANSTIMWCGVLNRQGTTLLIRATDTGEGPGPNITSDAWRASIEIALAKAYTALSVSSDQNALDSRAVGAASQPGAALWGIGNTNPYRFGSGEPTLNPDDKVGANHHGIVTFPGGEPVYDCKSHKLLGGLGVSGDSVDNDESVAQTAIKNAGFGLDPAGTGCKQHPHH